MIATNLQFASGQIVAAEALFGEPIRTYRACNKLDANVQTKLAGYASKTSGRSYQNKANYIRNIVDSYRSSLAITYVSSRPDDFRYNPNCDSKVFMACYHYARAQLASGGSSSFANSYKWTATQSFRNTVRAGLAVAMDRSVVAAVPAYVQYSHRKNALYVARFHVNVNEPPGLVLNVVKTLVSARKESK